MECCWLLLGIGVGWCSADLETRSNVSFLGSCVCVNKQKTQKQCTLNWAELLGQTQCRNVVGYYL